MNGAQVTMAGIGGGGTGLFTEWMWNDVLPRLFLSMPDLVAWPVMEMPLAVLIGSALLGVGRYVVSFLPRPPK